MFEDRKYWQDEEKAQGQQADRGDDFTFMF